jgi:hypothetical protein
LVVAIYRRRLKARPAGNAFAQNANEPHIDYECKNLMLQFEQICSEIGVPIANEKTEGPCTIIEYLGLTIDTVNMLIKIPEKKVQDLLKKIKLLSYPDLFSITQCKNVENLSKVAHDTEHPIGIHLSM